MSEIGELLSQNPHAVILVRMGLIAGFVVLVAILAERLGAFLGAMVASLPLYTGPVYLMLALERDAEWLAQATLGSIAICGISPVFVLVYCMFAIGHGVALSLGAAVLVWIACAVAVQSIAWTILQALLFITPIFVVTIVLARSFTRGIAPSRAERRWTDLALRAAMVAVLSGFTMWVSAFVPPQVAGVLSVAPVLTTSLVLVLHPRIGGRPTAALLAHTLTGLVGMVLAFTLIHLTIRQIGTAAALSSGLAVTILWNIMLVTVNRLTTTYEPAPLTASRDVPPALRRR